MATYHIIFSLLNFLFIYIFGLELFNKFMEPIQLCQSPPLPLVPIHPTSHGFFTARKQLSFPHVLIIGHIYIYIYIHTHTHMHMHMHIYVVNNLHIRMYMYMSYCIFVCVCEWIVVTCPCTWCSAGATSQQQCRICLYLLEH